MKPFFATFALVVWACLHPDSVMAQGKNKLTPAERIFQAKVKKARLEFDAAVVKARQELKEDLMKMMREATMKGDLDAALALRDRIKGIDAADGESAVPNVASPLIGRFEFQYSNKTKRHYVFTKAGGVTMVAAGQTLSLVAKPPKARSYWHQEGNNVVGFCFWTHAKSPTVERISVGKDGIQLLHYSKHSMETARGRKLEE